MFDVTVAESFESVARWLKEIHEEAPENCVIALCANKTDVEESQWTVRRATYMQFAEDHSLVVYESSAATAYNVNHVS